MLDLKYISARGSVLPLTGNDNFYLTNIDGQTAAAAALSTGTVGGMDGDTVNNAQANPRTIIFDLYINPEKDVETVKREILRYIKIKQRGALVWSQNSRDITISGYVESIDMPRWTNAVKMQITLHCDQPFWEDVDYIVQRISEAIDLHYFTDRTNDMLYFPAEGIPFGEYDTIRTKTFNNTGDVAVGLEIAIHAVDTVTNPIIYDGDGNYFGIGYGTESKRVVMDSGDVIKITTGRGNKTVTLNGVNIIDKVKPNSKWLQLEPETNQFTIASDDKSINNMYFNLTYKRRYI